MSGILTQDSISLTESLDGVRFGYLATSSRKSWNNQTEHQTPNTLGHNKRADSFFLCGKLIRRGYTAGPRRPDVPKWTVKFGFMSLSLDTLCVSEAWNWSHMLSLVRRYYVIPVHPHETDALIDTEYKTPWWGTDSLQTLQEIRHSEETWQMSLKVFREHFGFSTKLTKWRWGAMKRIQER